MKIEKKRYGFTLIEMLLVLAIIAIIATFAIPQVGKYINKANKTKLIAAVSELNTTSTSWSVENGGNIPTSMAEIFEEQGDLSKLGIGLQDDGTFKVGNINGIMNYVNSDGEIYAKISPTSKAYANEEIHSR